MGEAIGQTLSLGVGVALSPVPIIAVVLMLGTPRARINGPLFLAGWLVGLAVIGSIVVLLAAGADADAGDEPATWVSWVQLALGVLLLLAALRAWRHRPAGDDESAMPAWMQAIDSFSAAKALGFGALLSGINPKNLLLTLAAGTAIAETGISTGQQFGALAVYVVLGSLGVGIPVAIYILMPARAASLLGDIKNWMARHNAAIMTVLLLVIGTKLAGDAISGLFE